MARPWQLGRVAWYGDDYVCCYSSEDSCLNLTRLDWTRPALNILRHKSKMTTTSTEKSVMRGDVCANQLTEDMMKSLNRCALRVGCPDWEKPVKTAQQTR
ncbi:hypothetical protein Bbelb_351840 [Branchiostoma belcheri]|nr:hypothetical protein Bbelb_351840 [Branchiostoma belcheri]